MLFRGRAERKLSPHARRTDVRVRILGRAEIHRKLWPPKQEREWLIGGSSFKGFTFLFRFFLQSYQMCNKSCRWALSRFGLCPECCIFFVRNEISIFEPRFDFDTLPRARKSFSHTRLSHILSSLSDLFIFHTPLLKYPITFVKSRNRITA